MKAKIATTPTTMTIDMSENSFSKYEVHIKQWQLDGSEAVLLPGFPRTTSSNMFSVDKMQPGRYFQVTQPKDTRPACVEDFLRERLRPC